ncbi:MAG: response regulator [Pirellulales bacterium]
MADKPRDLLVGDHTTSTNELVAELEKRFEVARAENPLRALAQLNRNDFEGVYVTAPHVAHANRFGHLLETEQLLEHLPDGVALLDAANAVVWANEQFRRWSVQDCVAGLNFYTALGSPEILGPDFCPFRTAQANDRPSRSTLRTESGRYYQVHVATLHEGTEPTGQLLVSVRDISLDMQQQQKLAAIHRAGIELTDLTASELAQMSVDERIELLKSNILHYTKDLLNFDVIEIRLLDQKAGKLMPLLSVGFKPEAAARDLFARPQNNGVTGFVASTGKSYLCEDTSEDPLYLEGAEGAKSSLTVPLIFHEQVIGTFNVESTEAHAFTESDLQFLEIFCRDLAAALNTLELLVAEHALVAAESVEAIHSAVALPVDEILNDAVHVMERYIGHESEVTDRLQRILRNARDIKELIQKVGLQMAPIQAHPVGDPIAQRPQLRGQRILVADADENVRSAAHNLLERYGCVIETARSGDEALCMVRNTPSDVEYDVIIADIRLPDMTGYELFTKLREHLDVVPLALMTGFGYDPAHSLVKARQAGLKEVLYKPFRLDQLLETVERVIKLPKPALQA